MRSWLHTAGRAVRVALVGGVAAGMLPRALPAQSAGSNLKPGGLLRTGFRSEPEDADRRDGFEIFDARASLGGKVGIIFDYYLQGEFDERAGEESDLIFRLLDARLTLPIRPELQISFGQFKAPFGQETLLPKGKIRFLERSLANRALAPNRQVGVEASGEMLEGRLSYRAGIFNGNGRTLSNDDNSFLYAARLQYNTVGPIEFPEDIVLQIGFSVAASRDSAAALGPGLDGRLPGGGPGLPGVDFSSFEGGRTLLGGDVHVAHRGWELNAEYLWGEFRPDALEGTTDEDLVGRGGYVEGVYRGYGVIEGAVRYDAFDPALGPGRDFLLVGASVFPGFHAKFGLQYAIALGNSPDGPGIAGDQFVFLTQLSF